MSCCDNVAALAYNFDSTYYSVGVIIRSFSPEEIINRKDTIAALLSTLKMFLTRRNSDVNLDEGERGSVKFYMEQVNILEKEFHDIMNNTPLFQETKALT